MTVSEFYQWLLPDTVALAGSAREGLSPASVAFAGSAREEEQRFHFRG